MRSQPSLYASPSLPYTAFEPILPLHPNIHPYVRALAFACILTHIAVVTAPADHDVRFKVVCTRALDSAATLEAHAITAASRQLLVTAYWFHHAFGRSEIVVEELYEIDLSYVRQIQPRNGSATPAPP